MTALSALLSLLWHVGQAALTVSPFIVVIGLTRTPRNAVYITPETLVLIAVSCALRYGDDASRHLFALGQLGAGLHLVGMAVASAMAFRLRARVNMPKTQAIPVRTSADNGSTDEDTPPPANNHISQQLNKNSMICTLCFLGGVLIYNTTVALFGWLGMRWFGTPKSFGAVWLENWSFCVGLLQIVALWPQYELMIRISKARASLPHPNLPLPEGLSQDEQSRRLEAPKMLWAFLAAFQGGMAVMFPSLLTHGIEVNGRDDALIAMTTTAALHMIVLLGFVVKLKILPPGRLITLEEARAADEEAGIRLG
ncbi:hypothetical protein PANT_26d00104 [Moesziomyces antarcticus T-34]|uniref:Uncharacterized protein n=1 Tax=Pseudozyma antarctica (strain T-34) TaxID=1151754 RepID=M9M895_PSEA3|nr:hypothetical protein PANT_26d00104 [Moesziomyces antarcticus T-34]